jgi:hypothetical protein
MGGLILFGGRVPRSANDHSREEVLMTIDELTDSYRAVAIHGGDLGNQVIVLAWTPAWRARVAIKSHGAEFTPTKWTVAHLQAATPHQAGRVLASQWLEQPVSKTDVDCTPLEGWLCNSRGERLRQVTPAEAFRAVQREEDQKLLAEAGPNWFVDAL